MPDSAVPTLTDVERRQLDGGIDRLAAEFAGVFGRETVGRLVLDSLSSFAGARTTTFLPLLAERFARERLRALARMEGLTVTDRPAVLFLCVHNAGRSQMAAGFLRHLSGGAIEVFSGGSEPASEVNPAAVAAMAEAGVDIADEFPKPWTDETIGAADVVVTMGCGDACPVLPGKRYEDWALEDPAGKEVAAVRLIRDDIERRVRALMASLGAPERAAGA